MAVDSCFWTVQAEDFQENILNSQSVSWLKEELYHRLPRVFPGEIFKNGWLWTAATEIGGGILVYNRHSEQSVCNLTKRSTVPPVFLGEVFENGWLWTAASEQSEIAACNVIRFLTLKISFRILL